MNDYKWYILSMTTSTIGACHLIPKFNDIEPLFKLIAENRISIQKAILEISIDNDIKIALDTEKEAVDLVYKELEIEPILDGLITWN